MAREKGISTLVGLIIIIAVAVVAFGGVFAYQYLTQPKVPANTENNQLIVGGDRDAHGCIPSAGYSWCEAKQKCLRTWEEPCQAEQVIIELWPDKNSYNFQENSFMAKGARNNFNDYKNPVKIYTNSSTKIFSTGATPVENYDFAGFYALIKNWIGPDWWFTVKGQKNPDGSINATEISYFVQE